MNEGILALLEMRETKTIAIEQQKKTKKEAKRKITRKWFIQNYHVFDLTQFGIEDIGAKLVFQHYIKETPNLDFYTYVMSAFNNGGRIERKVQF